MAEKTTPFRKRYLKNTPFSRDRIIAVGLLITLLYLVHLLGELLKADKDAMPLGALASAILTFLGLRGSDKAKTASCNVCGSGALPHSPKHCMELLKVQKEMS